MVRRLTSRGLKRRDQLINYAASRFAENGFHPTSVTEIVNGLGVGKGVFYWYFDSKEEIFIEILRGAQRDLRRYQQKAIENESDPVARIEFGIRASIIWLANHPDFFTLLQFAAIDEKFSRLIRAGEEIAVQDVAQHIREGISQGRIDEGDPLFLGHAILGVTNQLTRVLLFEKKRDPSVVADAVVRFALGGLRGFSGVIAAGAMGGK
jgi:AcrR family transcriptional regulator